MRSKPTLPRSSSGTTINMEMDMIIPYIVRRGDTVLVDALGYYPLFAKLKLSGANMVLSR